jgi:hypothetical protein
MYIGYGNNRSILPVNYAKLLDSNREEWHIATFGLLPNKLLDADIKINKLITILATEKILSDLKGNVYWKRFWLPDKEEICQKNLKLFAREECPYYYKLIKNYLSK